MATIARKSSAPAAAKGKFDAEVDIIAIGSGVAGLATALFSAWRGNKVLVLEKASQLGGTTRKAAFWYWVPNNAAMHAAGTKDPKKDCIAYMARLSRPEIFNPEAPRFGVPAWEYSQYEAIYDNASTATELLSKKGALEYRHCEFGPARANHSGESHDLRLAQNKARILHAIADTDVRGLKNDRRILAQGTPGRKILGQVAPDHH